MTLRIVMIMLAAGNSRRFGSNKLLYEVDGIPMYRRVFSELQNAKKILESGNVNELQEKPEVSVTVVTQYEEIAEYTESHGAEALDNPHPEEGISSSIKIGLKANMRENRTADICLFCVSDQPWLTADTICRLIQKFISSGKGIACVSCLEKLGNPCVFSKNYYEELLELSGDVGGKKVIRSHMDDTEIFSLHDKKELEDIDFLSEERYTKRKC